MVGFYLSLRSEVSVILTSKHWRKFPLSQRFGNILTFMWTHTTSADIHELSNCLNRICCLRAHFGESTIANDKHCFDISTSLRKWKFAETDAPLLHVYTESLPRWRQRIINDSRFSEELGEFIAEVHHRIEIQHIVFRAFSFLCDTGAISNLCLEHHISWTAVAEADLDSPVERVYAMLNAFQLPSLLRNSDSDFRPFEEPFIWLAVMIVRGTDSIDTAIKGLLLGKLFGSFNEKRLLRQDPTIMDMQGLGWLADYSEDPLNRPPRLGWVLPSGNHPRSDEFGIWSVQWETRTRKARKLFASCYGESAAEYEGHYEQMLDIDLTF